MRVLSASKTVLKPSRSIWVAEMMVTGEGPSTSVRWMREPVTVTFSRVCALAPVASVSCSVSDSSLGFWLCASADAAGRARMADTATTRRLRLGVGALTDIDKFPLGACAVPGVPSWTGTCRECEVRFTFRDRSMKNRKSNEKFPLHDMVLKRACCRSGLSGCSLGSGLTQLLVRRFPPGECRFATPSPNVAHASATGSRHPRRARACCTAVIIGDRRVPACRRGQPSRGDRAHP